MKSVPTSIHPRKKLRQLGVCALFAVAVLSSFAQSAPAAKTPQESDTVVLDPFTVTSDPNDGYFSKTSTAAGRVAIPLENIPQHIEVFNSEFIKDTMPQTMQDILKFSTAVQFSNSERQTNGGLIRGFDASVVLRNGMNGFFAGAPSYNTETIEQVEVIRGPAAALYGASQPGGLINYVTKRPQFTSAQSVSLRAFSVGGYSASFDLTGPAGLKNFDGQPLIAYRLIVANEDRGGYQLNSDYTKRFLVSAGVTINPTKSFSITLESQHAASKTAFMNSMIAPLSLYNPLNGAGTGSAKPYQSVIMPNDMWPIDWTYQDDGAHRNETLNTNQLSLLWTKDLGKWGSWAVRGYYAVDSNAGVERILYSLFSTPNNAPRPVTQANLGKTVNFTQTVTQADIDAGRSWIPGRYIRNIQEFPWDYGRFQWDITGKFKTGPATHNVLIGTDGELGYRTRIPNDPISRSTTEYQVWNNAVESAKLAIWSDSPNPQNFSGTINWNDIRSTGNPTGVVTNVNRSGNPYTNNLRFKVPFLTSPVNNYYFFDSVGVWDDRLVLSLGARSDKLFQIVGPTTYSSKQWTYRYGAVFKVKPWFHLFGVHNESFIPNSQTAAQALGKYIPPQQGAQDEVGIRLPLWNGRLLIETSIYELTNTNVVVRDLFQTGKPEEWRFIDGQRNRGLDFDAKLALNKDTQVGFSYAHYNMVYFGNLTQVAAGVNTFPAVNVPDDQVSTWGKWTPSAGKLRNFSFYAAYRFTGKRPGGGTGALPSYMMTSYGVIDAGIGYSLKKWDFNLRVTNLLDERYYQASSSASLLFPGRPREATFNISHKF